MNMYCEKAIEILKELERSREDTIPPYNVLLIYTTHYINQINLFLFFAYFCFRLLFLKLK